MAIKFDFNRLRTAIKGFIKAQDTAGSEVQHIPLIQTAPVVEKLALGAGGTKVLLDDDFGKVFMCEQSGGTDSAVTLPAATSGGTLTFIVSLTPSGTGDMVISSATADTIVFSGNGDADADGASNLLADSFTIEAAAVGGERIDCVSDGSFWYVNARMNAVGSITTTG
tara:strand:- start:4215 stop:4718 length:504 start_codon:yes stop_codon:yes gene_type:complete